MHRFFVNSDQIVENTITIVGNDVNHIKNVLRMHQNDEIVICDGHGSNYYCIIKDIESDHIVTRVNVKEACDTELRSKVYLFQGLPKQDKMELIIQKAVELGVCEIIPVKTSRCVVKIKKTNEDKKLARWNKIAESAAKQSRRGIIPIVNNIMDYEEALIYAQKMDTTIVPYENADNINETKALLGSLDNKRIGVFIGPEGGFSLDEVDKAIEQGANIITLGKRILRTETAGLAILSLLMFQLEEE